jgi:polyribonucleotide nucleotidyltransferase
MYSKTIELGERTITFESGEIARQAGGSVIVRQGKTVLLAVATAQRQPASVPFLPLTVEFQLRQAAIGRIPGGYTRREGRGADWEVLTARLIDRSLRPLFPKGWRFETQVVVNVLSYDPESEVRPLAISAAAAALTISDIPWSGPCAGISVALPEDRLVLLPGPEELAEAELALTVAASRDGLVMAEGGGAEVAEARLVEAFELACQGVAPLLELQEEMRRAIGRPKRSFVPKAALEDEPRRQLEELAGPRLAEALATSGKLARKEALALAREEILAELGDPEDPLRPLQRGHLEELASGLIRRRTLAGQRLDGRDNEEIRAISGKVAWLPTTHGSALFTRGETQVSVTCTLGSERDAQTVDSLAGSRRRRFLLHYNFPSYSVGEVRPMRGPGRREIGHGHLARRALLPVLPAEVSYTVRLDAVVTESNGSSSMATVCGSSLALTDAGIELTRPVAGIAMGLVKEGDELVVLSDIQGEEDHVGDMDFKVAGTEQGVTAIQIDNKLGALPREVMGQALEQARRGRLHILARMAEIQPDGKGGVKRHAPRVATLRIERNRIRDLIGSGGATIRGIQERSGATIEVSQEGRVQVFAASADALEEATAAIERAAGVPELDRPYRAVVTSVKPFGSFVRLFEGIEGLLPGETALRQGETVTVKVAGVNHQGKLAVVRAD